MAKKNKIADQKKKVSIHKNPKNKKTLHKEKIKKKEKLNLIFLLSLILIVAVLFILISWIFIIPLIIAVTFTTLFYPLYKKLLAKLNNRKNLASILFCIFLFICILLPAYFTTHLLIDQTTSVYLQLESFAREQISQSNGTDSFINKINDLEIIKKLSFINFDLSNLRSIIEEGIKSGSKILTSIINITSSGIIETVGGIFFTFYAMFYLFRDGDKIIKKIRHLSPLKDEYEERLIERFSSISKATINGTFIIGIIQGIAGTITFILFGISGWVLWGVVMVILSIIPILGTYLVMVPVAIYKIAIGEIWQGIVIAVVAVVLNYVIDYFLRPILVGQQSKIHDLLIFISSIGGIAAFGVMGFIIGPVIAMFFITLLDIYSEEFKDSLSEQS